jgi:hypothetical protein
MMPPSVIAANFVHRDGLQQFRFQALIRAAKCNQKNLDRVSASSGQGICKLVLQEVGISSELFSI